MQLGHLVAQRAPWELFVARVGDVLGKIVMATVNVVWRRGKAGSGPPNGTSAPPTGPS
jgi:hypothetical protein